MKGLIPSEKYISSKYIGGNTNVIPVGNGPRMAAITRSGNVVGILNTVDKSVSLINTSSNVVYATPIVGTVTNTVSYDTLAFSPNGKLLYVANITDNTVSKIIVDTGVVSTIAVGTGPCACVVSPDGTKCYVNNRTSNDISVIDTTTDLVTSIPVGESLGTSIVITPDGKILFAGAFSSNNVYRIDLATTTVTGIDFGNHNQGMALTPDSQFLWVGTTQSIRSYTIATSTLNAAILVANGSAAPRMSPNGQYFIGHAFATNSIWKHDISTGVTTNILVGAGPNATSISPDSTIAYVACGTGNVISRIVTGTNAVSNIIMPGLSVRIAMMQPLGNECYCPQAGSNNTIVLNNLANVA